jgi:hypothetical protein
VYSILAPNYPPHFTAAFNPPHYPISYHLRLFLIYLTEAILTTSPPDFEISTYSSCVSSASEIHTISSNNTESTTRYLPPSGPQPGLVRRRRRSLFSQPIQEIPPLTPALQFRPTRKQNARPPQSRYPHVRRHAPQTRYEQWSRRPRVLRHIPPRVGWQ